MARYREKDETDLVWNRIRRHITRELDTSIQDAREEVLNHLLAGAWQKYAAGLTEGQTRELKAKYSDLIHGIVQDIVPHASSVLEDA